eukprot:TRINITY_DN2410_c1_g1_i1.p1 TRINITY_DN2410_c1_g1~~TRINITY_DN2410_c1_g1_i1.p1  ORF type:complete len:564 (+),score=108.81 TRINITY_DN2410_c1_g1_i1:58-1749(+)
MKPTLLLPLLLLQLVGVATALVKVGSVTHGLPGGALGVAIHENHMYYLSSGNIQIIDVSDVSNPIDAKAFGCPPGGCLAMEIVDGALYVSYPDGVQAHSLADPLNPALLTTFTFPSGCKKTHFRAMKQSSEIHGHIFITCFDPTTDIHRLFALSTTVGSMISVGSVNIPDSQHTNLEYRGLHIADGKVYVFLSGTTAAVVDSTDPSNLVLERYLPNLNMHGFVHLMGVQHNGFMYAAVDDLTDFAPLLKMDLTTGALEALTLPSPLNGGARDFTRCYDIEIYEGKIYLACNTKGLIELEEQTPNTFTLVSREESLNSFGLLVKDGHLLTGNFDSVDIFRLPVLMMVTLVGGPKPVTADVGIGGNIGDSVSGQRWVNIPRWLEGSTVHMGAYGKPGMSLRLACPAAGSSSPPCTFYVVIHNCLPCSTALNGGLPGGLLDRGFEAGSCGPRYVPTFAGAPATGSGLPTAIYKMELAAGAEPVVVPLARKLLHFAVFVHSSNQRCSAYGQDKASCEASALQCRYSHHLSACVDSAMCPKFTGPVVSPPGGGGGQKPCACFAAPNNF